MSSKTKRNIQKCERNGLDLKNIPENERTRELCEIAVKRTSEALRYVPQKFLDVDMCTLAVYKKNRIYEQGLKYVPDAFREDVLFRINKDKILHGKKFKNIPKIEKTKQLCEFAVGFDYKNIEFVPKSLRTKELIASAITSSVKVLKYINSDNDEDILDIYVMAANKAVKSYYYMPLKIAYEVRQIIKNKRDNMNHQKIARKAGKMNKLEIEQVINELQENVSMEYNGFGEAVYYLHITRDGEIVSSFNKAEATFTRILDSEAYENLEEKYWQNYLEKHDLTENDFVDDEAFMEEKKNVLNDYDWRQDVEVKENPHFYQLASELTREANEWLEQENEEEVEM